MIEQKPSSQSHQRTPKLAGFWDGKVILNVGQQDGVKPHQQFRQIEYGRVYDPDTHEELGTVQREIALVSAVNIFPRFCVCAVIKPSPKGWTTGMAFEWGESP